MEGSAKNLFDKMELLYENIYNLLLSFQLASETSNSHVTVDIKKTDGTIETLTINSFQQLLNEFTRIDNNYKSLINSDNISYTLNSDGSLSQVTKTSFINAEYLQNFIIGDGTASPKCIVDKTSTLKDMIFPNVKIPITIDSKLLSDVYCKTFEISSGWANIPENPTIINLEYLSSIGKIEYSEIDRSLKLEKNQIKYFGKFDIISIVADPTLTNTFTVILDDIKYTGLYTNGSSIDLKINDIFVSKTGASKYIINAIDKITKTLKITRIAGSEVPTIGISELYFNEIVNSDTNIVGVPVRPSQKIIVFLSTENFKNISYPSIGIKIDTSTYQVTYNNNVYSLDDFFGNYVTNISEYLIAMMDESTIPASLGVIPAKPTLLSGNFKVVQINKHLTDSKTVNEINLMNSQKQTIQNDITYKQKTIDGIQNEIDTQIFNSVEEKKSKLSQITSLKNEINILKTNLLNIAQNIDADAIKYGLKGVEPKYKVIGFWPLQTNLYSSQTGTQHIVKYEVLYRYLSLERDTVDNTSYSMIDNNGNSVTVAFSAWNELQTTALSKIKNDLGKLEWETQSVDSVNEININQCAISINEGESVEIKIRAVSEAGYPLSPVKSEWSDALRIEFPSELKKLNVSSTISQNNLDLNKAEFDNILNNYGLLNHISGTITEAEKTFLHSAKDITSGQFTAEQKNIPLDTAIQTLLQRISALESTSITKTVSISIVDFNNESFAVSNNTTMELFAGNYADTVNLLDVTKWGSIIRKKGYIKIKNNNTVPIELKSLVPGTLFDATTAKSYYNVPVQNIDSLLQKSKQIIYFRNVDLTGQPSDLFKLVNTVLPNSLTIPPDINQTAGDAEKNIITFDIDANNISTCKLKTVYSTDFVGYTTEHPDFVRNSTNDSLKTQFQRLKLFTANVKAHQYQTESSQILGFKDYDFYAVGQNTCGAFLYPVISNPNMISTVGDTNIATLIIPKESEILVPFIFEYRMIDRLGNINGLLNQDANTVLSYDKKIGIDIIMPDSNLFKFDINCTCKLKSKVTTADTSSLSSVIASYTGESQQSLT